MTEPDRDTHIRLAAFDHVRRLSEAHDHLTASDFKPGFVFDGERIPLIHPQRGIFKPQLMQFLLSVKAALPSRAARYGMMTSAKYIARFPRARRPSIALSWARTRTNHTSRNACRICDTIHD
jgi:hypothetical protein